MDKVFEKRKESNYILEALGRHVVAELFDCAIELLDDVDFIEQAMVNAAEKSGATIVNSSFHHFAPFGVSGVIVLQESHFAIHCWPEYAFASIDLFTCGGSVDPWIAFEEMKSSLRASHGSSIEMNRGQVHLLKRMKGSPSISRDSPSGLHTQIQRTRDVWFTERNEALALSIKHKGKKLFELGTAIQKIEVFDTHAFGKMLVLDGIISCTERDEYAYHEMMTHVPMLTHPDPKNILVIGGGDGGVLRELCKHPGVEHITMVEIDKEVIDTSKKFFPEVAKSFDDPRVDLRIEDGTLFVKEYGGNGYDVILVDSNDPVGPGRGLFNQEFYEDLYQVLAKPGIVVAQSQSPRFNERVFMDLFSIYKEIFGPAHTSCYLVHMPSYPTGIWSFSFLSKGVAIDPVEDVLEEKLKALERIGDLRYFNGEIHRASFALPNYIKKMI